MVLKRTTRIGNGQLRSECLHCGQVIIWKAGDEIYPRIDEDGLTGLLCATCRTDRKGQPEKGPGAGGT